MTSLLFKDRRHYRKRALRRRWCQYEYKTLFYLVKSLFFFDNQKQSIDFYFKFCNLLSRWHQKISTEAVSYCPDIGISLTISKKWIIIWLRIIFHPVPSSRQFVLLVSKNSQVITLSENIREKSMEPSNGNPVIRRLTSLLLVNVIWWIWRWKWKI